MFNTNTEITTLKLQIQYLEKELLVMRELMETLAKAVCRVSDLTEVHHQSIITAVNQLHTLVTHYNMHLTSLHGLVKAKEQKTYWN